MAVAFLFLTLESWLTPHLKGIFMAFPTKQILIIFDEVLIFVKDPTLVLATSSHPVHIRTIGTCSYSKH